MIPTQYVRSKERSMQRKRTEERAPNPTRGNNARSAFTLRHRRKDRKRLYGYSETAGE